MGRGEARTPRPPPRPPPPLLHHHPTPSPPRATEVPFLRERFPRAEVIVRGPERGYAAQLDALPGGGGFDCVLDSLGGKYFSAGLESLRPMGRIVHFGATYSYGGATDGLRKWLTLVPGYLSRPWVGAPVCRRRRRRRRSPPLTAPPSYAAADPGKLVGTNRSVMGFNLIWLTERVDVLMAEVDEMCSRGGLLARPPAVGRAFSFSELPEALRHLNSGASVGKVVVEVEAD